MLELVPSGLALHFVRPEGKEKSAGCGKRLQEETKEKKENREISAREVGEKKKRKKKRKKKKSNGFEKERIKSTTKNRSGNKGMGSCSREIRSRPQSL